jgi:hypothetical protein
MKKIIVVFSMLVALLVCLPDFSFAQTTVKKKTNTSHKGKSAAIGAAIGAGTGAVVSKKKGKGALIGAAAGAGAGYLYGRHRDKKHPKVVKKTKTVTQ